MSFPAIEEIEAFCDEISLVEPAADHSSSPVLLGSGHVASLRLRKGVMDPPLSDAMHTVFRAHPDRVTECAKESKCQRAPAISIAAPVPRWHTPWLNVLWGVLSPFHGRHLAFDLRTLVFIAITL